MANTKAALDVRIRAVFEERRYELGRLGSVKQRVALVVDERLR